MKKTLLITGFDPFGGATVNPSMEAVKLLPEQIGDYQLVKLEIPTVFGLGAERVLELAEKCHPDVIISVGQAGTRSAVTPERIGVNIRDAKIADNAGFMPKGRFVAEDGPAAYFSTLPVEAMAQAICDAGLPTMCCIVCCTDSMAAPPGWALSMYPGCLLREAPAWSWSRR